MSVEDKKAGAWRIASWNINSVRLRMPLLARLVAEARPDVVCLQETKVRDDLFPLEDIKALGFSHVLFRGEKGYNGVAILSRMPLQSCASYDMAGSVESRHIAAVLPDGTVLHNFYVPAGGDIPDPAANPKYDFKLRFVEDMTARFKKPVQERIILVGDLNIAPLEHDVWSHKQLLNVVSHTPPETERMELLQKGLAWVDVGRHFTPEQEKLYSWWSYRNQDWKKSNRGRRLDHIWVTPALKERLQGYQTFIDARDWPQPSDHVPILADIAA